MVDLDAVGGLPAVMRSLLDAGLIHGDCLTVTTKTVAENLATVKPMAGDQDVIAPVACPLAPPGQHVVILSGNLCPGGGVIKLSGKGITKFR